MKDTYNLLLVAFVLLLLATCSLSYAEPLDAKHVLMSQGINLGGYALCNSVVKDKWFCLGASTITTITLTSMFEAMQGNALDTNTDLKSNFVGAFSIVVPIVVLDF